MTFHFTSKIPSGKIKANAEHSMVRETGAKPVRYRRCKCVFPSEMSIGHCANGKAGMETVRVNGT